MVICVGMLMLTRNSCVQRPPAASAPILHYCHPFSRMLWRFSGWSANLPESTNGQIGNVVELACGYFAAKRVQVQQSPLHYL